MNRKRRRRRTQKSDMTPEQKQELMDGHTLVGIRSGSDRPFLQDVGKWGFYEDHTEFKSEKHRQRAYVQNKQKLIDECSPFTRPAAWWIYEDLPERKVIRGRRRDYSEQVSYDPDDPTTWKTVYEDVREYLKRNDLLTDEEERMING